MVADVSYHSCQDGSGDNLVKQKTPALTGAFFHSKVYLTTVNFTPSDVVNYTTLQCFVNRRTAQFLFRPVVQKLLLPHHWRD